MGSTPDNCPPLHCSAAERQTLIGFAHEAIHNAIRGRRTPDIPPETLTPTLLHHSASFVTLVLEGTLRGCVGNLEAQEPVYLSVIHNAAGAALRDSRFPPVTLEESSRLLVHISILSALAPCIATPLKRF